MLAKSIPTKMVTIVDYYDSVFQDYSFEGFRSQNYKVSIFHSFYAASKV